MNFKNLKFTHISSASQLDGQLASQRVIRPGSTSATYGSRISIATQQIKGNRVGFTKLLEKVYPLRHGDSFYPVLVSFRLQIAHRKVRKLQKVL